MGFDWRKTLGAIAPIAGTMIGGPFGAIAGAAVGKIFGHPEGEVPTETEMAEYIAKATPEQLIALKQIDSDLRVKMKELDIREEQLTYDDTKDARAMQVAVKSKMPAVIVVMLTVGFFLSLYAMMTFTIPEENKAIVYTMVGSLGTAWIASIQFFVGTTNSSADKNHMFAGKK